MESLGDSRNPAERPKSNAFAFTIDARPLFPRCQEEPERRSGDSRRDAPAMRRPGELPGRRGGAPVEASVRAAIAGDRAIEVVGPAGGVLLVGHLAAIGLVDQLTIERAGHDPRADDGLHGGKADPEFAAAVRRREVNAFRGDLRL